MNYFNVAIVAFALGFFVAVYFYLNPKQPSGGELIRTVTCPVFVPKNASKFDRYICYRS